MSGYFAQMPEKIVISYIVLAVLLIIDTLSGIVAAYKFNRFNWRKLLKLATKSLSYTTVLITIRLLEIGINIWWDTEFLSEIILVFLEAIESISILENLASLGVPIPGNFLAFLLKNIKIPGIDKAIQIKHGDERVATEIDEIIRYQLPIFHNKIITNLLEIKYNIWKDVAMQIHIIADDNNNNSNQHDLFYYRVMSIIEIGFKEISTQWKEQAVNQEYISKFQENNRTRVEKWMDKIKEICYSSISMNIKKDKITDSLITYLYQTFVDALKIYNGQ